MILKLALSDGAPITYATLAEALAMSASQVYGSVHRGQLARLLDSLPSARFSVVLPALQEFVLHGVKYVFPAILGPTTRGIPTAFGGPTLRGALIQNEEGSPVWPFEGGDVRGPALYPLYPNLPMIVRRDPKLYDLLTLIDALRIGASRDRELATAALTERLR